MPDDVKDGLEELLPPLRTEPGTNNPPSDIEILQEKLREELASLFGRQKALLGAVDRAPLLIDDEETSGKMADLARQIAACRKAIEDRRVAAKEPFLALERAVDAVCVKPRDELDKAKKLIADRLTAWQRKKEAEERRRREEAERAAAEAAKRAQEEANKAAATLQTEADLDAAIAAEDLAKQATADAAAASRASNAKAAELSRTRGDYGAVASLRGFIDFDGLDRATLELDALRPYLPQDAIEKAVRAYIRARGEELLPVIRAGNQPLKGVRIFENSRTAVR